MNPTDHDFDMGAQWLPVATVAARLGISERTVQRRAQRGELEARAVSDEQGKRLLIRLDVPTGADKVPTPIHVQTGEAADTSRVAADKLPTGEGTTLTAHLLSENAFLRGVIEQLQRDGAEVRAALRKALDAPRQLEQGSAINATERAQNSEAGSNRQQGLDAPQIEQNGEEMDAGELLALCRRISK